MHDVRWERGLWRILKRLLPAWYRQRYGADLLQTHIDLAGGEDGARGGRFWWAVTRDVLLTSVGARFEVAPAYGDARRSHFMEGVMQDVVQAVRRLWREPVFTLGVAITLALGIGANATVYALVDRLLLRPPAGVVEPDGVHRVFVHGLSMFAQGRVYSAALAYPDYGALRDVAGFEAVAARGRQELTLGSGAESERVKTESVTASYFALLGIRPLLGRLITDDDDQLRSAEPVMVLGHGFWQRRYGGDPDVIGRRVDLGKGSYTIVGVAQPRFSGIDPDPVDVWLPLHAAGFIESGDRWVAAPNWYWLDAIVRVGSSVDIEAVARAATDRYRATRLAGWESGARRPGNRPDPDARIVLASIIAARGPNPPREAMVTRGLALLSGLVLLIACANVMNLLLARGIQRRRMFAVQSALGAGRARVARQMLVESLLLAVLGGAAALLVARVTAPALLGILMPGASVEGGGADTRTVFTVMLLVAVSTLLAGVLPSWRASRVDVLDALRGRGITRRAVWMRRSLLMVQAALSVILLVGAGLFLKSVRRAATADLGVTTEAISVSLELPDGTTNVQPGTADPLVESTYRALEALRAHPAVRGATITSLTPFGGAWGLQVDLPNPDTIIAGPEGPFFYAAGEDYFETLGMTIVRGRALNAADDMAGAELVTVVNEKMAATLWPGEEALGQCLLVGGDGSPCTTVVGVVRDHRNSLTAEQARATYFLPPHHQGIGFIAGNVVIVRVDGAPEAMAAMIRDITRNAVPNVRFVHVRPLRELLEPQMRPWRLGAAFLGVFGVLALVIAAAGLYAVLAFEVANRRFELGVRSALGASGRRLVGSVAMQTLAVTLAGVGIGFIAAIALAHAARAMFFDVSAGDPAVHLTVALTLAGAATLAGAIPAIRALRVDPMTVLRQD